MKLKLIFILLSSVISLSLFAQMNISTNLREDSFYDEDKEEWIVVSTDNEELTFFEFNKALTMFKHTTPTITSAYIIKSSISDKETSQWQFTIVSDVGNKYYMILDKEDNSLHFMYKKEDVLYMVTHHIKKIWFDEEDDDESEEFSK